MKETLSVISAEETQAVRATTRSTVIGTERRLQEAAAATTTHGAHILLAGAPGKPVFLQALSVMLRMHVPEAITAISRT